MKTKRIPRVTVVGSTIKESEDIELEPPPFRVNLFGFNENPSFSAEINSLSWYDVMRNALGWYLLPFYIIFSKLLKRKIGW